jgi:hypothetical protein
MKPGSQVSDLVSIPELLDLGLKIRTAPICLSIVAIRLFAPGFSSLLVMTFSTASTTPSLQRMPMEVPPFSTALTAYSTWKFRPSGEKTEFVRS